MSRSIESAITLDLSVYRIFERIKILPANEIVSPMAMLSYKMRKSREVIVLYDRFLRVFYFASRSGTQSWCLDLRLEFILTITIGYYCMVPWIIHKMANRCRRKSSFEFGLATLTT